MKVVIAADIFPPDIGGPATYAKTLLDELPRRGIEVKLVCYSDQSQTKSDNVVRVVRQGPAPLRYLRYTWALWCAAKHCDLIYAMGPVSAGYPASLVARLRCKPLAVKVVGDYAWEQARNLGITTLGIDEFQASVQKGKVARLRQVEAQVCKQAVLVITPSEYLKKIVVGWGVAEENVKVIYNGVEAGSVSPTSPRDPNLLISVGRLVPWKGFATLIALMPALLKVNPAFRLIILGSGPEEQKLKALITELNLEKRLEIKKVDPKTRDQLLAQAATFILNTGYEGLPHAVLEAMAQAAPVITTRVGGNPEVVTDAVNGFLVNYEDPAALQDVILRLYRDRELAQRLGQAGFEQLKRFNLTEMVEQTIKSLSRI